MKENFKSEGQCLYCGKMFAKAGINRHLNTHLKDFTKTGEAGKSFLVKVITAKQCGATPYFLCLWVDGETSLKKIDIFLRDIWLECCGHLSAFNSLSINGKKVDIEHLIDDLDEEDEDEDMDDEEEYDDEEDLIDIFDDEDDEDDDEDEDGEEDSDDDEGDIFNDIFNNLWGGDEDGIPMKLKAGQLFSKGVTMEYEYDFGSSTYLTIEVVDEYPVKAVLDLVLLSRNEPLKLTCPICGKAPATQLCSVCMYDDESIFCNKCAKKHAKKCDDFANGLSLPVVNSPRMGVCGYEGGSIDKARDGVGQM